MSQTKRAIDKKLYKKRKSRRLSSEQKTSRKKFRNRESEKLKSTSIARHHSFVKYFSESQKKRFAKKFGYKRSTLERKRYSKKLNNSARYFWAQEFAKSHPHLISKYSGQSEEQIKRGRLSDESLRAAYYHIKNPLYYGRLANIKQITYSFDSDNPESEIKRIIRESWKYIKKKSIALFMNVTVRDITNNKQFMTRFNTAFLRADSQKFIKTELFYKDVDDRVGKFNESYNFIIEFNEFIPSDFPESTIRFPVTDSIMIAIHWERKYKKPSIRKTKKKKYKKPGTT